jgi:hypothetical protein
MKKIFSLFLLSSFASSFLFSTAFAQIALPEETESMEGDTAIELASEEVSFSDTESYEWKTSIEFLVNEGIVQGYDDGTFKPNQTINRAEFTKILIESSFYGVDESYSDDCFSDVSAEDWFSKYVCFAKEANIISGNPDGSFAPAEPITQPAALKIILNVMEYEIPETEGEWFDQYLDYSEYLGMYYFQSPYVSNSNSPESHETTRGETAYFIDWMLNFEDDYDQISDADFYGDNLSAYLSNWYLDTVGELEEDFSFGMLESDCFEQELYSEEYEICYLAYDVFYDEEWAWDWDYDWDDYENDDEWDFDEVGDPESMAVYTIEGSELTLIRNDSTEYTEEEYEMIWDYFAGVIPESYREHITGFEVFTDGYGGTLAAVAPTYESDYMDWTLYVDIEDTIIDGELEEFEFPLTVIHEYAHVLTLQDEQVPVSYWYDDESRAADEALCDTLFLDEGCANEDSYIYQFYLEFWADIEDDHASYYDGYEYYYDGHETDFITEYAATNAVEDLAETFSYFVFYDQPSDDSTLANEKILFLYEFEELLALRSIIRQHL